MLVTQSGPEALAAAVRSKSARNVAEVLSQFPELKKQLDQEMVGASFGETALLAAVNQGNREMVDVLLKAGANINQRSHWWAGSFGVLDNNSGLHDFLIERGAILDAHAAARLGRLDALRAVVDRDPGVVHARGGDGQLPLHFASTVEVAEFLLERGADIDATDVDHESTAAQWMIDERHDVVRNLVSRGCRTDILLAAALGDVGLVLHYLATNPDATRTVVSEEFFPKKDPRSGGTIYTWTLGSGKGPHLIARKFGHDHVFRIVMEASPLTTQLGVWCELADRDEVDAILGRDPAIAGTLGAADLRRLPDAARDENAPAVGLLLDAGWPIDARGQHGTTALHWAAFHGNTAMVRDLLRRTPPLEIRDKDFDGTPLSWGIYGSVHGWRCRSGDYVGVVETLLDAGATPPPVTDGMRASEAVREALRKR
jgi:ankyrin repeat protein